MTEDEITMLHYFKRVGISVLFIRPGHDDTLLSPWPAAGWITMTETKRVLEILTIRPQDLSTWTKLCRKVTNEVAIAHPDYPTLSETQLLSFIKRMLPDLRARVASTETIRS
jgi:hypothetical protein